MTDVMKPVITELQIFPIKPHDGLIGFASLVLDNHLYLSSIGIFTKLDGSGYRFTYPTKIIGDRSIQIYHPISSELSQAIESAIYSKLIELFDRR